MLLYVKDMNIISVYYSSEALKGLNPVYFFLHTRYCDFYKNVMTTEFNIYYKLFEHLGSGVRFQGSAFRSTQTPNRAVIR